MRVTLTFGGGRRDGAQDMIADLIRRDQRITMEGISSATGMSRNRVSAELAIMKSQGRLARIGGPRGRWDLRW